MVTLPVLLDIVITLTAALILGALFERLRHSAIVGYIVAGVLVGPFALNFVRNTDNVQALADIGLALLLFIIGLEFSWGRLKRLGRIGIGGGSLQILLTGAVVYVISRSFGICASESIALGAMLAVSSTAVVMRSLSDRAEIDSAHGRNAVGILLLQDVAIIPLALLVAILGGKDDIQATVRAMVLAIGSATVLIIAMALIRKFVLKRLLTATSGFRNRELAVILAVVACIGAMWGAGALGLSTTLGAFMAGMFVAASPFAEQIRADLEPFRAVFLTLFFASIGMLMNILWIGANAHIMFAFVAAIIVGKAVIVWLIVWLLRYSHKTALATGIVLSQIGELSFVLAGVAQANGILKADTYQFFASATAITLLFTPYIVLYAHTSAERIERFFIRLGILSPRAAIRAEKTALLQNHIIVVGFGQAGRRAAGTLKAVGTSVFVLELNPQSVKKARREGFMSAIGDATQDTILRSARIENAQALVVTTPDLLTARTIIVRSKMIAPKVPVIARARYHAFAKEMKLAGADSVVDEENLMGEQLGDEIIKQIGLPVEAMEAADTAVIEEEKSE